MLEKCKHSTKLLTAPLLPAFMSDADVKSKVPKHGVSCPQDSGQLPPWRLLPVPIQLRGGQFSSGSWRWDSTSAGGTGERGGLWGLSLLCTSS